MFVEAVTCFPVLQARRLQVSDVYYIVVVGGFIIRTFVRFLAAYPLYMCVCFNVVEMFALHLYSKFVRYFMKVFVRY